jgi:hypothetical protein
MSKPYDVTSKDLIEAAPADWVALFPKTPALASPSHPLNQFDKFDMFDDEGCERGLVTW